MLELILLVFFFLSSRFADFTMLGIILAYGAWALFMQTYQPEMWLKIREAEDHRRARICGAVTKGITELCSRVVAWISPQNS